MTAVRVRGLGFAGTSTDRRAAMVAFLAETMGLERVRVEGVEADLFRLPDGSHVAVASPGGMGETSRSIGFLVDDLDEAVAALARAGVAAGEIGANELERYIHFRAPDGELYELMERVAPSVEQPAPEAVEVDERDSGWEVDEPRFRVYIGSHSDATVSASVATYDLTGTDVLGAIAWARREIGPGQSYAVALVHDDVHGEDVDAGRGRGLVWLLGGDPNDPTSAPNPRS